jgi:tRNA pseudouridine13 synthase
LSKYSLNFLPAYPRLPLTADFKLALEDFQVTEILGFQPAGEGEHLFLRVRKKNLTTDALINELARAFNVSSRDIGCCGLKDKLGVTEQWLSVVWPIKKEVPVVSGELWEVLEIVRHNKKLKRGIHKGNEFRIRLKNIKGDLSLLDSRLELLATNGFPNYFGEQRFGMEGRNVEKAELLFAGQLKCKSFQRSIYYSAARSYLFNCYLSARIQADSWNKAIAGDCFNLNGSNSIFGPEEMTEEISQRMASLDIHAVGVLAGSGNIRLSSEALSFFNKTIDNHETLVKGLIVAEVKSALRPLRVIAKSLNWQIIDDQCELQFSLPAGSYATALLHELVSLNEAVW